MRAFRRQCDQAVAHDASVQAYVRELEQAYDTPGDAAPRPRRDDAFNPEQLMHDLEDFLRQEREGGASDGPFGSTSLVCVDRTPGQSFFPDAARQRSLPCRVKGKSCDKI